MRRPDLRFCSPLARDGVLCLKVFPHTSECPQQLGLVPQCCPLPKAMFPIPRQTVRSDQNLVCLARVRGASSDNPSAIQIWHLQNPLRERHRSSFGLRYAYPAACSQERVKSICYCVDLNITKPTLHVSACRLRGIYMPDSWPPLFPETRTSSGDAFRDPRSGNQSLSERYPCIAFEYCYSARLEV